MHQSVLTDLGTLRGPNGAAGFPLKDNRGLIAVLLKLLLRIHWENGLPTKTGACKCCWVRSPSKKEKNLFLTNGPVKRPLDWIVELGRIELVEVISGDTPVPWEIKPVTQRQ